ncbi:uncharacterized protein LOC105847323 [Hydra vulgaris]|uniref:uncharacterized protein LOC105847323 n=1 Tax=Hydra vulgaris TaxID=6087 RepID=UPI001F5E9B2E|nr:uncharacterized protein LOC105847323 [Hydra vulgaris]XP_012562273.2 uncharacterized protein LOC105847323 [Hydra vulgaris]
MSRKEKKTISSHDGRPPQLTLGDFMYIKKSNKQSIDSIPNVPNSALNSTDAAQYENIENFNVTTSTATVNECSSVLNTCKLSKVVDSHVKVSHEENQCSFFVCQTKKGGAPIEVQKRASGKKVTLIENVYGDANSLLNDLKTKFGTGGLCRANVIELQGDFKDKVIKYLTENRSLRPYGSKK